MKYIWLSWLLLACSTPGQQKRVETPREDKSDIVLLHGSHLDHSVWTPTIEELPQVHHVAALDVPDRKRSSIPSLAQAAIQTCQQVSRPSVFVVHSIAGAIVHAMVGVCPEKIKQIIYVSGVVVLPGERTSNTFLPADQEGYARAVDFLKDSVMPKTPSEFYAAMAGANYVVTEATPPLYAEHNRFVDERLVFSEEVWKKIPKNYIYTLEDAIIGKATQEQYVAKAGIVKTRALQSGHLPMITHPEYLADALMELISE